MASLSLGKEAHTDQNSSSPSTSSKIDNKAKKTARTIDGMQFFKRLQPEKNDKKLALKKPPLPTTQESPFLRKGTKKRKKIALFDEGNASANKKIKFLPQSDVKTEDDTKEVGSIAEVESKKLKVQHNF